MKTKEGIKIGNLGKTTEWFKEKVFNYHGNKVEILSNYLGGNNPIDILYHCELHGDTYKTLNAKNICKPYFLPCKECQSINKSKSARGSKKKDKNYYYERLREYCKNKGGKVLTKGWVTAKTTYAFKCDIPDHPIFYTTADALYSGNHWCPYCAGRSGDFYGEIKEIVIKKGGVLLSEYINAGTKVMVMCKKHNYSWDILPSNIKKGRWCPICNMPFAEKVVYDYFINHQVIIEQQYKFDDLKGKNNEKLKFDFAIFNSNNQLIYLLEIDDEEHRYNFKSERRIKAKQRDEMKNKYCADHNLDLYRMIVPFKSGYKNNWDYKDYYNYINTELKFMVNLAHS